ncbi:MAG TPA: hypothetical protein VIH61_00425, partial [Waddliaceae bacterium]
MTLFDPTITAAKEWENSWLAVESNSLRVTPKKLHGKVEACIIWLGRIIQALVGYRSNTYSALSSIRSVFIEKQKEISGDIKIFKSNLDAVNEKIKKHNDKQFWKSCKIA